MGSQIGQCISTFDSALPRWNGLRISSCVIRMRRCYIIGQEQRCSVQFVWVVKMDMRHLIEAAAIAVLLIEWCLYKSFF